MITLVSYLYFYYISLINYFKNIFKILFKSPSCFNYTTFDSKCTKCI